MTTFRFADRYTTGVRGLFILEYQCLCLNPRIQGLNLFLDGRSTMIYGHVSKVEVNWIYRRIRVNYMPPSRFPIPQGTLDMLILQILSLEPAHGYGIAQRLGQISRSVVRVNQGSLYPALHRLEQKGWLRSEWKQSETGREAKFYALTRAGRKHLKIEKDSWSRLTGAVQLVFDEGN